MNPSRLHRGWHLVQFQLAAAVHQRVAWVLSGAALAVVLAGAALRTFNFGAAESRFFVSVAEGVLVATGTLLAAVLGPALLGEGGATRTAPLFFSRGVRRSEWVGATLAAVWVVLGWLVVLLAGALTWLLVRHGHGSEVGAAWRQLAGGATGLVIVGAGAVLFAAVFERAAVATTATVALAVAGQLAPILKRLGATSTGAEALGWRALDWLVPNFSTMHTAPGQVALLYVVGYAAVYAVAAAVIFSRREL
ncbi:MAG: hypothetical protein C0518_16165 [Opitutus sp.]|nr:hypothetical protein [Opitutus sp.]